MSEGGWKGQYLTTLLSGAVCALACFGLFLSFAVFLPKAEYTFARYSSPEILENQLQIPWWTRAGLAVSRGVPGLPVAQICSAISCVLFVFALIPIPPKGLTRVMRRVWRGWIPTLLIVSMVFLMVSGVAQIFGHNALYSRMRVYQATINEFSLDEEAEEKIARINRFWSKFPEFQAQNERFVKKVTSPENSDRRDALVSILKRGDRSDEILRRLVGTAADKQELITFSHDKRVVLDRATELGAPEFDSVQALADWLSQQEDERWKPLPYFTP